MDILTDTSRDTLELVYDRIATFIPFEESKNKGCDRHGERYIDKEYLICMSTYGTENKVYVPIPGTNQHKEVGFVQFVPEKAGRRTQMKVWFLSVEEEYNGLGLGSMLMASVKQICMERGISTMVLDAARRYKDKTPESDIRHPETKDDGHYVYNANLTLYREMGFEIDREDSSYVDGMEDDFTNTNPIPMVCELDGIVAPAAYQQHHHETLVKNSKESEMGMFQ